MRKLIEQLDVFQKYFPNLNTEEALKTIKDLPELPEGAERWQVFPKPSKVAKDYNDAVNKILFLVSKNRNNFLNCCKNKLGAEYMCQIEDTHKVIEQLETNIKGDYLVLPVQTGIHHYGRSVLRARLMFSDNEFGLCPFIIGCILISDPDFLAGPDNLIIDCAGIEYSPSGNSDFLQRYCLCFKFNNGELKFDYNWVINCGVEHGAASGFLL